MSIFSIFGKKEKPNRSNHPDRPNEPAVSSTLSVRVNYPNCYYRFGEVTAELPIRLSNRFHDLGIDYFNLCSDEQASNQTIYLSYDDCVYLAKYFAQFRESPVSVFRNNAFHDLLNNFRNSDKDRQRELFIKYFGSTKIEELETFSKRGCPGYFRWLESLFEQEVAGSTLDIVLKIQLDEFGKSVYDLDWHSRVYDVKTRPQLINGIPYLVTKSGDLIAIALETAKEKVLILNSYYDDGGPTNNGPGSYLASREPTVTIPSTEFDGHVAQY